MTEGDSPGGAIRLELLDRDDDQVAGLGPLDLKRSGLRIGPLRDDLPVGADARRRRPSW